MFTIKLKVGDEVLVRRGKDKGKTGKVTAVHHKENKVTVEGINIAKKHLKPSAANPRGRVEQITKPVWVANVGIAHPTAKGKSSRIGYKISKDGSKKRVYVQANHKEIK